MSKIVTIRLSDEEYKEISNVAKKEHRPISNFITSATLRQIEESFYVDPVEMAQIKSDKKLMKKLKTGHSNAKSKKGNFVG